MRVLPVSTPAMSGNKAAGGGTTAEQTATRKAVTLDPQAQAALLDRRTGSVAQASALLVMVVIAMACTGLLLLAHPGGGGAGGTAAALPRPSQGSSAPPGSAQLLVASGPPPVSASNGPHATRVPRRRMLLSAAVDDASSSLLPASETLQQPEQQGSAGNTVSPPAGSDTGSTGDWEAVAGTPSLDYRIIGGWEAKPSDFKWFCSIRSATTDAHFCGCSLIAPNLIMTAAHCLDQRSNALAFPGIEVGRYLKDGPRGAARGALINNDFDQLKCVRPIIHPAWTPSTALHDISVCELDGQSRYTPVVLADDLDQPPATGAQATVLGFGATSEGGADSATLLETDLTIESLRSCNASYGGVLRTTQLCAGLPEGGRDACQGDSGGPLIVQAASGVEKQFGIVSFGAGCGRAKFPGVYTNIIPYTPWIKRQIAAAAADANAATGGGRAATNTGGGNAAFLVQAKGAGNATGPQQQQQQQQQQAGAGTVSSGSGINGTATVGCSCSADGVSGQVNVGKVGCRQHGAEYGDLDFYCYVSAPAACSTATPSSAYPGAAWRPCTAAADGGAQQSAPRVGATGVQPLGRLSTKVATRGSSDGGSSGR